MSIGPELSWDHRIKNLQPEPFFVPFVVSFALDVICKEILTTTQKKFFMYRQQEQEQQQQQHPSLRHKYSSSEVLFDAHSYLAYLLLALALLAVFCPFSLLHLSATDEFAASILLHVKKGRNSVLSLPNKKNIKSYIRSIIISMPVIQLKKLDGTAF